MTEEESIRLYQFLSSEYAVLDLPTKQLLHKLEKELFRNFTVSQIDMIQQKISGEK